MTARELSDFTKVALTKQFQSKGNSGSMLLEELQPVIVVHDLEQGPNKPFARFTVEGSLAAVAAQFAAFNVRLVNPSPPQNVEQTLILDSIWTDQPWHGGLGTDAAFDTPVSLRTCRDHDLRRARFDTGTGSWFPGFLDDIVTLQGNSIGDRATQPMFRGLANIITPVSVIFPRKLYTEPAVPTLNVLADVVNTTMKWCVSGRLFSVAS